MGSDIIAKILDNLLTFIPGRMVYSYQKAVKFRGGKPIRELKPGWYWFVPIWESIDEVNTADEVRDLPVQSVTTKDGVSVTFSCNICYRVVNATRNFTKVQEFDAAMQGYAMVYLAKAFRSRTWQEVQDAQAEIESNFIEALSLRVRRWGAKLRWAGITDLVPTPSYRLFGGPAF